LAKHTLLHDDSLGFDDTFPDWEAWLTAAGVHGVDATAGPRYNTASDAIGAAIGGAGILLARWSLVVSDVADGRLVRLFDIALPVRQGFHVVFREGYRDRPEVNAFHAWLFQDLTANARAPL
jgi:LysR family glycine cleavage system transcriptional activator